ncbi:MAG: hypothetical protein HKN15_13625 [Xanthomonadales bacterium]|nr:hypothetical protein [Xanthomonadales bacterium]
MSDVLCIAGMHRSGTSLVTNWLSRSGLVVHDGQPLPATTGNPAGHFEDAEFALLQHHAILAAYPDSKGWVVTDPNAPKILYLPPAAKLLVQRRIRKYPLWGWKDPRSMHFLHAWKALIPDMKSLIVWRHPQQVIDSLLRRAEQASGGTADFLAISEQQALALWLASNRQALDYAETFKDDTLVVSLDLLLRHSQEFIPHIRDRLGIPLEAVPLDTVYDANLLGKTEPGSCPPEAVATVDALERISVPLA